MERYRGRAPLRSRAHDPQAAAGRGDPPAPAGLKRRKGTGYFLWKYTSEGIQKLPSVQPQVEPVQQTPLAYSNVTSPAVNRTLSGFQPELSHPPRMETPLLAALVPFTCWASSHLQFPSSAAHVPKDFFSFPVKLRCHVTIYPRKRGVPRGRRTAPTSCW